MIGVLLIFLIKSNTQESVFALVFFVLIISTSSILSTGEKKCMPMKFSGLEENLFNSFIDMVEVLEAKIALFFICFSDSFITLAFKSLSSKTASMIRSQSLIWE